ncbi:MAG TPA: L-aspartate oxidase [Methylomusa anaerophila]|uniref:L-aspartate oxidase n=1 Tax=Methylomusa anaerophila TaxID=1930071 RepID=A0A348AQI6_9FIRM|nr:L-aspartate oxidase [Methylomusa anaerophila]BBB93334.1 L-aspartate oxidase [Methylomusa anaerophila]HML86835.1 L-aspartate oxidase [Methylomusa anaerophila]
MKNREYIIAAKLDELDRKAFDVVIIGSGIAGMSVALTLNSRLRVLLVSKTAVTDCSTYKAQGGMAVAVGADDTWERHMADTLKVGQGLCRQDAVQVMTEEGPAALDFLESWGAKFNRSSTGGLYLTREAGHSCNRIIHYYDYTGRHIAETMVRVLHGKENIERLDKAYLLDILTTENGYCCGCIVWYSGRMVVLEAAAVVIATGGYSGLYARSTNAASASGDGIAAAYRAGAVLADMEFVQFHPTAFTTQSGEVFLLTEALRGEGAVLRNSEGNRFMLDYHADGELAPRDTVSRAMRREMRREHGSYVYLDATSLDKNYLSSRFRQVYSTLVDNDLRMETDLIPVAPAAHYTIGGVWTDLWGQTSVPQLYACGETAATGVHGANRLASNSLLEGIVFGRRAALAIDGGLSSPLFHHSITGIEAGRNECCADLELLRAALDRDAGVVRREEDMGRLLAALPQNSRPLKNVEAFQSCNAYQLAKLVLEAAILRRESRGTHYRSDYPERDDMHYQKHIEQQWERQAIWR